MITVFSAKNFRLTDEQFEQLFNIIRIAYAETEKEVWGEGYVRMSREELQHHIDNDEILIALLYGKIVGGIRYYKIDDETYGFGLLGADFDHKGKGIGRALIGEVENKVKATGGKKVSIEILRASAINTDFKTHLAEWYQRLGYKYTGVLDVNAVYDNPAKWAKLVNPSHFDCYLKEL
ncbi:MAG: GNAT family N-acetyltransferase [Crocinitomicaceae bacterium]|nr:GNAT family N-acetyltransferase [Crocinitomicaceae bacterium]